MWKYYEVRRGLNRVPGDDATGKEEVNSQRHSNAASVGWRAEGRDERRRSRRCRGVIIPICEQEAGLGLSPRWQRSGATVAAAPATDTRYGSSQPGSTSLSVPGMTLPHPASFSPLPPLEVPPSPCLTKNTLSRKFSSRKKMILVLLLGNEII